MKGEIDMPDHCLYIVTKHYNTMAYIVGRPQSSLSKARRLASLAKLSKGQFKAKAIVRIWKLASEAEVV
jgi:hypothetical protein